MKYIFYSLLAGCVIIACNNNKPGEKHTGETIAAVDKPANECYMGTSGRDSVMLNLKNDGDRVSGTLSYKFHEKDSNHGSIDGVMHGDTLLANYSFASEGIISDRQVAFLKKDNRFIEGYGDMEEREGKLQLKSPASLTFGKGFILEKVDCK
jgi:hypothetical protein